MQYANSSRLPCDWPCKHAHFLFVHAYTLDYLPNKYTQRFQARAEGDCQVRRPLAHTQRTTRSSPIPVADITYMYSTVA